MRSLFPTMILALAASLVRPAAAAPASARASAANATNATAALAPAPGPASIAWMWDGAAMPAWSAPEAAVLYNNILLSGDRIYSRRRMTRARLAAGTRVTPLLHVEVSTVRPPVNIEESRPIIVAAM